MTYSPREKTAQRLREDMHFVDVVDMLAQLDDAELDLVNKLALDLDDLPDDARMEFRQGLDHVLSALLDMNGRLERIKYMAKK